MSFASDLDRYLTTEPVVEGPCLVCGQINLDLCLCPECPVCSTFGDPKCYEEHGLVMSDEQGKSYDEYLKWVEEDRKADEAQYQQWLEEQEDRDMADKALFGTRIGAEDWQEELITEVEERFEAAKAWAIENGFNPEKFRVVTVDGTVPDFAGTVKKFRK